MLDLFIVQLGCSGTGFNPNGTSLAEPNLGSGTRKQGCLPCTAVLYKIYKLSIPVLYLYLYLYLYLISISPSFLTSQST